VRLAAWQDLPAADALILAVAHRYLELPKDDLLKKVVRHGVRDRRQGRARCRGTAQRGAAGLAL
jgi:hypothetical protein